MKVHHLDVLLKAGHTVFCFSSIVKKIIFGKNSHYGTTLSKQDQEVKS